MPNKLRIYWVPQVPMKPFIRDVKTLREAKTILKTLAFYDLFCYENRVRGDYCNAGGLQEFDPHNDADSPEGSWCDWYSEEGFELDELSEEQIDAIDAERKEEEKWSKP